MGSRLQSTGPHQREIPAKLVVQKFLNCLSVRSRPAAVRWTPREDPPPANLLKRRCVAKCGTLAARFFSDQVRLLGAQTVTTSEVRVTLHEVISAACILAQIAFIIHVVLQTTSGHWFVIDPRPSITARLR